MMQRSFGRKPSFSLHMCIRVPLVVQVSVCPDIPSVQGTKAWHVMVSSGTPGDSVQLLCSAPAQAAEPSPAHVPEAAQPAAQLDAKSQHQRRSGAGLAHLPDSLNDCGQTCTACCSAGCLGLSRGGQVCSVLKYQPGRPQQEPAILETTPEGGSMQSQAAALSLSLSVAGGCLISVRQAVRQRCPAPMSALVPPACFLRHLPVPVCSETSACVLI